MRNKYSLNQFAKAGHPGKAAVGVMLFSVMMTVGFMASAAPEPAIKILIKANPDRDSGVSTDDLFEGASMIEATNVASGSDSDPRDLFGGTFSEVEPGHVIGSDVNPLSGWSVKFATARPVTIEGFNLFLADDGNGARSAKGFTFYQGDTVVASGSIATPYLDNYDNHDIVVAVRFSSPVTGNNWKLELDAGTGSGIRALELDAVTTPKNL